MNERRLLADVQSRHIVNLEATFQDDKHLYMVMEYLPGGDFMDLLIKHKKFSEEATKFYIAELVQALKVVHDLGYVHRDIKPDNLVLTKDGHLKLLDFGLCAWDFRFLGILVFQS